MNVCPACGAEVAAALLACPACHRFVHADELKTLAADAERASRSGDKAAALAAWQRALTLLPPESRQHAQVEAKVSALAAEAPPAPAAPKPSWARGAAAGAGAFGLAIWKLKWLAIALATKGKLLLLGLTKLPTLLSMAFAFGVYMTAFGWKFALGLLLTTYVHEIGHVAWLRRYGIAATAPMFIPGVGALVRLKQAIPDVRIDARVGLAGPLWGLAASAVCAAVAWRTGWAAWAAIAHVSAWINLFNLIPLGSLDGGRGLRALAERERLLLAGVAGALLLVLGADGAGLLLIAIAVAAAARAGEKNAPAKTDWFVFVEFAVLLAALALLGRGRL
jgi:Zn-dependent protease